MISRFSLGASCAACTLSLLTATPTAAQDARRALTLDDVVATAVDQSPTLRASVLSARSADLLVDEEAAAFPFRLQLDATGSVGNTPQLSPTFTTMTRPDGSTVTVPTGTGIVTFPYTQSVDLGAQVSRALPWGMTLLARVDAIRTYRALLPTATSQQLAIVGPGYGFNAQLQISQSLLRGFGEDVGLAPLRLAEADRVTADATRDRTASALLRDVIVAYWELWYAERALEIQRTARDVFQRQWEDARRRADLGASAGIDALTLEAQLATADTQLASAELTTTQAAITLAALLGDRSERGAQLSTVAQTRTLVSMDDASIETSIDGSPEVMEAQARVEATRVASRVAGQALLPLLDVAATFSVLGLGYDDVGQTFSNFGSLTAVQLMGTLTYQTALEDTQLHRREERAVIATEIAEQSYEAARAQAIAEARAAREADVIATRRLALAERAVEIARRALAAQEERRTLGTGLLLDVLTATQTLRQAELERARAEVDAQLARVRLLHLRGELLRELGATIRE